MLSQLCSICASIDLLSYFQREAHVRRDNYGLFRPIEDALNLGSLSSILSGSASCVLL